MKRYLLILSLLIAGFTSCKKTDEAASEDTAIKAYIATNNINATKDPSGLYYSIITPGTGAYPSATSNVNIDYTGKLLNGSVFAPASNANTSLGNFIKGWQIGVPHINTGGRILLIVPSALAYGTNSPGASIPANSVLVFTIDLLSFSN